MGAAWLGCRKGLLRAILGCFFSLAVLGPSVSAQDAPCDQEVDAPPAGFSCPNGIPLPAGSFQAVPLMDGNVSTHYPPAPFGGFHSETVTLYGEYGNAEDNGEAQAHFTLGQQVAEKVQPLDQNGNPPGDGSGAIVVLFIGFSNCEIEVCGGQKDAWSDVETLPGQPCATDCQNPKYGNPQGWTPWNIAPGDAGVPQQSLLWQTYSPDNGFMGSRVGQHVYLFNGAKGHRPLPDWDPFSGDNRCVSNRECNYQRVHTELTSNGFSDNQVQVVFLYDATSYPTCDLSGVHCGDPFNDVPDSYLAEQYMGDIMRYLKQGYNGNPPRYPKLQQVFLISRNYGGYAKNPPSGGTTGCVNPEPFSYEEGFGVQRLIVAQIKQNAGGSSNDSYSGMVKFSDDGINSNDNTPWFDWGPYLWASGKTPRNDGLLWCNSNGGLCGDTLDFRNGDAANGLYGDLTHPRHTGQTKAATQILNFILQSPFTTWRQQ